MATNGKFTLIQQNDTHAQMELHWEGFWRNGELEYRRPAVMPGNSCCEADRQVPCAVRGCGLSMAWWRSGRRARALYRH